MVLCTIFGIGKQWFSNALYLLETVKFASKRKHKVWFFRRVFKGKMACFTYPFDPKRRKNDSGFSAFGT
jgi:hypothetical protein